MAKIADRLIILTIILRQEEGVWAAECKELGTATFGETFEEARENLKEAIEAHLNTLEDVGERERFFRENGIKVYKRIPKPIPTPIPFSPNIFINKDIHKISSHTVC